jgi:hypothetical protein
VITRLSSEHSADPPFCRSAWTWPNRSRVVPIWVICTARPSAGWRWAGWADARLKCREPGPRPSAGGPPVRPKRRKISEAGTHRSRPPRYTKVGRLGSGGIAVQECVDVALYSCVLARTASRSIGRSVASDIQAGATLILMSGPLPNQLSHRTVQGRSCDSRCEVTDRQD